jgi:hypothetical protein
MAKQPTTAERIDYLVGRRFPLSYLLKIPPSSSSAPPPDTRELRIAVEAFRRELAALTPEALVERFNEAKGKEFEQLRAKAEEAERERFYNHPSATADFDHWAKAAHWTLDEAIALSLGKAPELVRWEKLHNLTSMGSPFVTLYARRRDLALRAKSWDQLYDPVLPGIFLAWAKRTDLDVPSELIEAVEKRGVQVADWKSLYEQAAAALKSEEEERERQVAGWKKLLDQAKAALDTEHATWLKIADEKNQMIEALKGRVAFLEELRSEKAVESADGATKGQLGTKERESLLKIIIGMARGGYVYDPKLNRSAVPQEIASDLAKHGVPLDVDTVRKWLKEAAEFLPGE